MNAAFDQVIGANDADRRDAFLATARRLGTAVSYIEKDFWVCWALDAMFNAAEAQHPRLLFKGAPPCRSPTA
jgi:predicted nucleotidyltransferase component of viral defense system